MDARLVNNAGAIRIRLSAEAKRKVIGKETRSFICAPYGVAGLELLT